MGYRIDYAKTETKPSPAATSGIRVQAMTAAFLLAFVLLVRGMWPKGREILRQYLLPGELTHTQQAFACLMSDIRQGSGVGQALTVFCEEIICNGR